GSHVNHSERQNARSVSRYIAQDTPPVRVNDFLHCVPELAQLISRGNNVSKRLVQCCRINLALSDLPGQSLQRVRSFTCRSDSRIAPPGERFSSQSNRSQP